MALSLNIGERTVAVQLLNDFKGKHSALTKVYDDLKNLLVTAEEWEAVDKQDVKDDKGNILSLRWDEEKADAQGPKDIELSEDSVLYLKSVLKERDEKNQFTLTDTHLASLYEKLQK